MQGLIRGATWHQYPPFTACVAAVVTASPAAREQVGQALKEFPDTRRVFAERSKGGRDLDIAPHRDAIARYHLSVDDITHVAEITGTKSNGLFAICQDFLRS